MAIKNNLRATAAPTVTDDSAAGYSIGSHWYNKSTGTIWVCRSNTASAAEWQPLGVDYEPWPSNTYRLPENCAGTVSDMTLPTTDTFFLFPFMIRRPIAGVALAVSTIAGTAGAAATFGLYPTDLSTGKPDGQTRLGGTLAGGLALDSATGVRGGSFATRDLVPGLYWVGVLTKGVVSPAVVKGMVSNGKYIHRDLTDVVAGTLNTCLSSATTYSGSAPGTCPGTSAIRTAAPMPALLAA